MITASLRAIATIALFSLADPKTLLPQVETVRDRFGIASLIMVGDRGMISNVKIEAMRTMEGVGWITALKSGAIATLAHAGHLQLGLFDERNLISFTSEDYPASRWWPAAIQSLPGCARQNART
jgi:hypothetical protein